MIFIKFAIFATCWIVLGVIADYLVLHVLRNKVAYEFSLIHPNSCADINVIKRMVNITQKSLMGKIIDYVTWPINMPLMLIASTDWAMVHAREIVIDDE